MVRKHFQDQKEANKVNIALYKEEFVDNPKRGLIDQEEKKKQIIKKKAKEIYEK